MTAIEDGDVVADHDIPKLVRSVAAAAKTGVIIILDELGKNLEFAAQAQSVSDLFLLQQLAELPSDTDGPPVLLLCLLHQGFTEYAHGLSTIQRNEWEKVQGRFEDIVFSESPEQMLLLVANAIEKSTEGAFARRVEKNAIKWHRRLRSESDRYVADILTPRTIADVFPLHPLSALLLPRLCARYAQSDRSLFSFLASNEPHSFSRFLEEQEERSEGLSSMRLDEVYDYFLLASSHGLSGRSHFQRWTEVHGRVSEQRGLDGDELAALKVVGLFNLVSASGPLRATRNLVVAALCDDPTDSTERSRWAAAVDALVSTRLVTYRRQLDELRIWEGSDFDTDEAIRARIHIGDQPIDAVLSQAQFLRPVVAHRHSYRSGTLRYFERCYIEEERFLRQLEAKRESDGIVVHWLGRSKPQSIPTTTIDGKPVVLLCAVTVEALRAAAIEYSALREIELKAVELQSDGVARREVKDRLAFAKRRLEDSLQEAFDPQHEGTCWIAGKPFKGATAMFNSELSHALDLAYSRAPVVWNELINRRELSSQGARARRELVGALLSSSSKPRLGITGDGPEYSMYASVLLRSGMHRLENGKWTLGAPTEPSFLEVWKAIENFLLGSKTEARNLQNLYDLLQAPPYGVKSGVIPVLIGAAVLVHSEDVSIYKDGTFLPLLGPEHFELLVKQPSRFTVKYFELSGFRRDVFQALQAVLQTRSGEQSQALRNASLLGVVKPMVRMVTMLPSYARKTQNLSSQARAVRTAVLTATEPDDLLFRRLPEACEVVPVGSVADVIDPSIFVERLLLALNELQTAYDALLSECRGLVFSAFGVRSEVEKLREDLAVRSRYLMGQVIEPRLRSFIRAAASDATSDREWLEAIVMVIADKPAESWLDEDELAFEMNLSDLARRFANLESLQKERAVEQRETLGFEASRVTITSQDGEETHRLVWIEKANRTKLEAFAADLLSRIDSLSNDQQKEAVAVLLTEHLLAAKKPQKERNFTSRRLRRNHG